jgi:hypothetical protein
VGAMRKPWNRYYYTPSVKYAGTQLATATLPTETHSGDLCYAAPESDISAPKRNMAHDITKK